MEPSPSCSAPAAARTLPLQQRPLLPALPSSLSSFSAPSPWIAACWVVGGTSAFLLLILYRDSISYYLSTESDPRPLSITEQNTERNRSLSDSSDSEAAPQRRRLRRPTYLTDSEDEGDQKKGAKAREEAEEFKMVSKPLPVGVKSCIKRSAVTPSESAPPSPSSSNSTTTVDDSPAASPQTARKSVKIVDPSSEKASLEAMRELWSGGNGVGAGNGIAGYRRTRDIYHKGQGGTATIRRAPTVTIIDSSSIRTEDAGGKEQDTEASEGDDDKATRRSPRLATATSPSSAIRSSSLSPSSATRTKSPINPSLLSSATPSIARSPSPAFIVGRSGSSRTASPSPARVPLKKRSSSNSGGSGSEGEVVSPRWVKSKGKEKGVAAAVAAAAAKEPAEEEDGFEDVSSADVSGASTPVKKLSTPPPPEDLSSRLLSSSVAPPLPDSPKSARPRSLSNESPTLPFRRPSLSNGSPGVALTNGSASPNGSALPKSPPKMLKRSVVVL